MTPSEHYNEAQRLLTKARTTDGEIQRDPLPGREHLVAAAHVHALLAQTPTDTYMETRR